MDRRDDPRWYRDPCALFVLLPAAAAVLLACLTR